MSAPVFPSSSGAENPPVEDLPLYWQGWANAIRLMDGKRTESDHASLRQAAAYEKCAEELRAALKQSDGVAQAAPEPVAWRYKFNPGPWYLSQTNTNLNEQRKAECPDLQYEPLYTHPAQEQQFPCRECDNETACLNRSSCAQVAQGSRTAHPALSIPSTEGKSRG